MLARPVQLSQFLVEMPRGAVAATAGATNSAVLNGSAGGPANGALIIATERNTSGRNSTAHQAATGEPKSWPKTPATERWPSAATTPSASLTSVE